MEFLQYNPHLYWLKMDISEFQSDPIWNASSTSVQYMHALIVFLFLFLLGVSGIHSLKEELCNLFPVLIIINNIYYYDSLWLGS